MNLPAVQWKLFEVQAQLISTDATAETLIASKVWMQPHHYDEVIEERTTSGICGYPSCNNEIVVDTQSKYRIDYRHKRVFEIGESRNFCCEKCVELSRIYRSTIENSNPNTRKHVKSLPAPTSNIDDILGLFGDNDIGEEKKISRTTVDKDVKSPPHYSNPNVTADGRIAATSKDTKTVRHNPYYAEGLRQSAEKKTTENPLSATEMLESISTEQKTSSRLKESISKARNQPIVREFVEEKTDAKMSDVSTILMSEMDFIRSSRVSQVSKQHVHSPGKQHRDMLSTVETLSVDSKVSSSGDSFSPIKGPRSVNHPAFRPTFHTPIMLNYTTVQKPSLSQSSDSACVSTDAELSTDSQSPTDPNRAGAAASASASDSDTAAATGGDSHGPQPSLHNVHQHHPSTAEAAAAGSGGSGTAFAGMTNMPGGVPFTAPATAPAAAGHGGIDDNDDEDNEDNENDDEIDDNDDIPVVPDEPDTARFAAWFTNKTKISFSPAKTKSISWASKFDDTGRNVKKSILEQQKDNDDDPNDDNDLAAEQDEQDDSDDDANELFLNRSEHEEDEIDDDQIHDAI